MPATKEQLQQYVEHMQKALAAGEIKVISTEGQRVIVDTLTEQLRVVVTETAETAEAYYKTFVAPAQQTTTTNLFDTLPRVSMYIGAPDTGKTHKAFQVAQTCGITPLLKMCRDNLNLETLLEDFVLVDGKPVFNESLALKMMTGTDPAIIILDEFNTLLTGVMKTLQPIFDDTSTTFEYRGKVYHKNLNCKFIVTLNDKDKGISVVPDAILSRCCLTWFEPAPNAVVSKWSMVDPAFVNNLRKIYEVLGLLSVFGTRQVKMLYPLRTQPNSIKNHLYGLCMMKNIDAKVIDTVQVQSFLAKL